MNKAEEQLQYVWGQTKQKDFILEYAYEARELKLFIKHLRDYCMNECHLFAQNKNTNQMRVGRIDYLNSIIHAIDGGIIKDWPSFVEYMTGEDYEQKPKCETCNDTKEVPAPHYSSKGEAPDCDFITCQKCGVDE